jgi:hypothetical protein
MIGMAILSWSGRRQLMYYGVGIIILVIFVLVVWATFFTAAPTCFDGKQDGTELGVDCGGSCALVCTNLAHEPLVLWARPFQTGPSNYTAAAYIQNNNQGAGAKNVAYSFQLFDANNSLVVERDGVVNLPPVQTIPIIEPNITVGNRTVTHVEFAFSQTPPAVWSRVPAGGIPTLQITQQNLNADASRLGATIVNNTLQDAEQVTVTAVLFDSQGVARAASKSLLPVVSAQSSVPVVFTWSGGVPNIVRAEITILPSF